jgi:hypothetical protein
MAIRALGYGKVSDYVAPALFIPLSLAAVPAQPHREASSVEALAPLEASLQRIGQDITDVTQMLSRITAAAASSGQLYVEAPEGALYDDIDHWTRTAARVVTEDREGLFTYDGSDAEIWL